MKINENVASEKSKELELFLFLVTHDLRSPLVNIDDFRNRLKKQIETMIKLFKENDHSPEIYEKIDSLFENDIIRSFNFIFF